MKFGLIPTEGGRFYQEFIDEALLGEQLSFDSVLLEEHHDVKWMGKSTGAKGPYPDRWLPS